MNRTTVPGKGLGFGVRKSRGGPFPEQGHPHPGSATSSPGSCALSAPNSMETRTSKGAAGEAGAYRELVHGRALVDHVEDHVVKGEGRFIVHRPPEGHI